MSNLSNISIAQTTINETMSRLTVDSTVTSTTVEPPNFSKAALESKMEEVIHSILRRRDAMLAELDDAFKFFNTSLTEEQLNIPVPKSLKMADLTAILTGEILALCPSKQPQTPAGSARKLRRSRSLIRADKLDSIPESPQAHRSSSVGLAKPRAIVTPTAAMTAMTPLSSLASVSRYTVRKRPGPPVQQTVQLKRIMKAGEEAISTAGSPLFVQARVPCEPEVNIPLRNGVILNIDTASDSKRAIVPHLDEETKKKLKIIVDKLQKCCDS